MTNNDKNGRQWPRNIKEAVERILSELPEEHKEIARNVSEFNYVVHCHHTLGQYIRNQFGLQEGNQALLNACGAIYPDNASSIILSAVWEALHEEGDVSGDGEDTCRDISNGGEKSAKWENYNVGQTFDTLDKLLALMGLEHKDCSNTGHG